MELEFPRPMKIEESGVKDEVINLDDYTSSEDRARRWHRKVRHKIILLFGDENEDNLILLMTWYIDSLADDISEIEVTDTLMKFVDKHLQFFHTYFKELRWINVEVYLDSMEQIVAVYLDLICERYLRVDEPQRYNKNIRRLCLKLLKVYLLNNEEHMYHVLMKVKLNLSSEKTKQYLDNIFRVLLTDKPKDISDLAFCRSYILHQRWKKVLKPETHKSIDEKMYANFSRTPEEIDTNPVLKQILQPQNDSVLDVLAHIMDSDKILCESYFRYIQVLKDLEIANRLAEEQATDSTPVTSNENGETSSQPECTNSSSTVVDTEVNVKTEDEGDCLVVGEGCDPEKVELVHEILDDDDDIVSIIYFTAKDPSTSCTPTVKEKKDKQQNRPEESFLSTIVISETDANKENNNTENHSPTVSISAPSPKLQNVDNDSVKSREILSRKFTRKKDDSDAGVAEAALDVEETDNDECTYDIGSDWDGTKPNNDTEEPSHRFEGLVTPPTSHDDQHSYERDFQNPDLQEIAEEHEEEHEEEQQHNSSMNSTNTESDNSMSNNTPHSTISNNSDLCNGSTNLPEIQSNSSWVSPSSPDLFPACAPINSSPEEVLGVPLVEEPQEPNELIKEPPVVKEIPKSSEVPKKNGNIVEHNNNMEERRDVLEKQLKVSVSRLDVSIKSVEKKMEVLFSSQQTVKKMDNEVHLRYNALKGEHGLDDCLSGAIEKISCPTNAVGNFDLFDDNPPARETPLRVPSPPPNVSASPSSITSPDFDGIDDFKSYLANYQEESNKKATLISRKPNLSDKAQTPNRLDDQRTRLKADSKSTVVSDADHVPEPQIKRKRIAFAEEEIVDYASPHEPIIKHSSRLQGILKKPVRTSRWRIPKEQMNLQSLARYKVKPNDPCLQGEPCVVVEMLSESEISEWHQVSEVTRNIRMQKSKNSLSPKNAAPLSMTMLRVDYDKSTPWLTENDTVLYRVPEGMTWRSNAQLKIDLLDEGTHPPLFVDYFYIPTVCKNDCCSIIVKKFKTLALGTKPHKNNESTPFLNIPINPFSPKIVGKEKTATNARDYCAKSSFIDLNVVNKIVENFDKCDEPPNPFDFINQPAIVPEVEEFEKTLKMNEEIPKVSNIPSDLHNLNLRRFSPSPIMNYFSPHSSPCYTYFSDCSNFNDRINSFQDLETDRNLIVDSQVTDQEYTENSSPDELEEPKMWITVAEEQDTQLKEDVKTAEEDTNQKREIIWPKTTDLNTNTEEEPETRLPLKKRKLSVANAKGMDSDEETIGPEVIEEIIKKARVEKNEKDDISYPAKPAISIAEIQEKLETRPRTFKTPAQKKEMPPPNAPDVQPSHKIVTEQYNNHTYNNPTINYHMNNVPYPFFPCTSLTYFPPIILPINSTTTFDMNVMNPQQSSSGQQVQPPTQENVGKVKEEKRSKRRKKE